MKWIIAIMMVAVFMAGCTDTCNIGQDEVIPGPVDGMEQDTPLVPEAGKEKPEAISVSEFMKNPVYDKDVKIYGRMEHYGELMCPCFMLRDKDAQIDASYGLMFFDDGTQWPDVSMQGYSNGDWVVLEGQLLSSTGTEPSKQFYIKSIEKMEPPSGIDKSEQIARQFIQNSPEFEMGGMLELEERILYKCPDCYAYKFKFITVKVDGFDQEITPHEAFIEVIKGEVTRAELDADTPEAKNIL